MRINGKILAAIAMPVVTAVLVGTLLNASHHTTLPPFNPPATFSPLATQLSARNCIREIPKPFTGVAVGKVSPETVQHFNHLTNSRVGIVEFYNPFPGPFDKWAAERAVALRDVPFIQLNPGKLDPRVLKRISTGADDTKIKNYARSVKNFNYCVIISFGHEMNGWWYRWGAPWNTPRTFIKAWRHVHSIFASIGANNVIWSWDPSHQYGKVVTGKVASPASKWYPGNAYVDWIGIDGYLGMYSNHKNYQKFSGIFEPQISVIMKKAPSKPIFLAETGVAYDHGNDIEQIQGLFRGIKKYGLAGLIWFQLNRKQPWELTDSRKAAAQAYHRGMADFPPHRNVETAANLR
jgi:Glycosyl hydrolase family 26